MLHQHAGTLGDPIPCNAERPQASLPSGNPHLVWESQSSPGPRDSFSLMLSLDQTVKLALQPSPVTFQQQRTEWKWAGSKHFLYLTWKSRTDDGAQGDAFNEIIT